MILSDLYHAHGGGFFTESAVIPAAHAHGIQARPRDVRDRFVSYLAHGYAATDHIRPGQWKVTDDAAKKFGFFEKPLEKNKAPDADAQEPQEFPLPGDQTGADELGEAKRDTGDKVGLYD